jgi:hypothetical protein
MNELTSTFGKVRITKIDNADYGSVYDALVFLGIKKATAKKFYSRLKNDHPQVVAKCHYFKFEGRGQRDTPVADLQTLMQICGKTREGHKIDDLAYKTLANLLTDPSKLVDQAEAIHGQRAVNQIEDRAKYLTSFHSLGKELEKHITDDKKAGMMYGTVHKHNNRVTAIQAIQKLKLNKSNATNWNAVNECKATANDVKKMID